MFLKRVRVPDFRVLKDVDITFEPELTPSIFPVGSLNGGGKSTLLQLIFVLLHCSVHRDRREFLRNMLYGFEVDNNDDRPLAIIDLWDGTNNVILEFLACKDGHESESKLSIIEDVQEIEEKIESLKAQVQFLNDLTLKIGEISRKSQNEDDEQKYLTKLGDELVYKVLGSKRQLPLSYEEADKISRMDSCKDAVMYVREKIDLLDKERKSLVEECKEKFHSTEKITKSLSSKSLIYVCKYLTKSNQTPSGILLCHVSGLEINKANEFLEKVSQKIFLGAPTTQVFLFLNRDSRKLLFVDPRHKNGSSENSYFARVDRAKAKLPNFFPYDFFAVDLLTNMLKEARDRDFAELHETGEYGNTYKNTLKELNLFLFNKKLTLDKDFSNVGFQIEENGSSKELYPEDLSHGELKLLSIYMWIRYHNIEDAIVLMDEIEIALNPDWQYTIVRDLESWSPTSQYILATHSYELCQALSPPHVKEIEPKLVKREN